MVSIIFDPKSWWTKNPDFSSIDGVATIKSTSKQVKESRNMFSENMNVMSNTMATFSMPKSKEREMEQAARNKTEYMFWDDPLAKFNFTQIKTLNGKKYYLSDGFDEDISEDGDESYDMSKFMIATVLDGGDAILFYYISETGGERYLVYVRYNDSVKMKEIIVRSNKLVKGWKGCKKGVSSPSERPFNGSKRSK